MQERVFLVRSFVFLLLLVFAASFSFGISRAAVTCGSTCYTAADVAQETVNYQQNVPGSKCLFIYSGKIYQPPANSIANGMHKNEHVCGADVTGIMKQSHLSNPNNYLLPYLCAPLCSGCQDADGDGFQASSCGGTDCNDNNPAIKPGSTETCNNIDDNCNGVIDENLQLQTSCGVGACLRTITQTCTAGSYSPACTPGNPTTETCNGVDDNCNGQTDEGGVCSGPDTIPPVVGGGYPSGSLSAGTTSTTMGVTTGEAATCRYSTTAGASYASMANTFSTTGSTTHSATATGLSNGNTYNYYIRCMDGAGNANPNDFTITFSVSSNTTPSPPPSNTSGGNISFPSNTTVCVPACAGLCGQNNGCGGSCPNNDIYTPGKCGNSACVKNCTGGACGQPDGCGGICSSDDAATCGICGNLPCCTQEVCDDQKDNDCDGLTDEGCSVVDVVAATPGSFVSAVTESAAMAVERTDIMARLAGILAFFFAGLTLQIGIFRKHLINRFGRKRVIRFHITVGLFSFLFLAVHLASVLLDSGWSQSVDLLHIFFPQFEGIVLFGTAFGTVGMYLLAITIIGGAFFIRISKKFGYRTWVTIHRLSFVFYIFVFIHALRIGTDFNNPYIIVFFLHIIVVIAIYVIYRVFKKFRTPKAETTQPDEKNGADANE